MKIRTVLAAMALATTHLAQGEPIASTSE